MKVKQHVYSHADGFAIGGGQNSYEHHLNPGKQKAKKGRDGDARADLRQDERSNHPRTRIAVQKGRFVHFLGMADIKPYKIQMEIGRLNRQYAKAIKSKQMPIADKGQA